MGEEVKQSICSRNVISAPPIRAAGSFSVFRELFSKTFGETQSKSIIFFARAFGARNLDIIACLEGSARKNKRSRVPAKWQDLRISFRALLGTVTLFFVHEGTVRFPLDQRKRFSGYVRQR